MSPRPPNDLSQVFKTGSSAAGRTLRLCDVDQCFSRRAAVQRHQDLPPVVPFFVSIQACKRRQAASVKYADHPVPWLDDVGVHQTVIALHIENQLVAGQAGDATADFANASSYFAAATTAFTGGEYFSGVYDSLIAGYEDILGSQADTLAALFTAGI